MTLPAKPTTEIKGKTIKDYACISDELVITFTDNTWSRFFLCDDEMEGPSNFDFLDMGLYIPLEVSYRLGFISKEEYNDRVARRRRHLEGQEAELKVQRHKEYLKLREEFGEEDI